jgi:phage gp45-like
MGQYGSLQNLMMSGNTATTPEVGMGATILLYTDRHAATVVKVSASGKEVTVQRDKATRRDGNGMSDAQSYDFTPDPTAAEEVYTLRKNGAWVRKGQSLSSGTKLRLGSRSEYYDYSF